MTGVEVVSPNGSRGHLLRTDSPLSLVEGLEAVVRGGITDHFDDVAWVYYHGVGERLEAQADPGFQRLATLLEERGIGQSRTPLSSDVNVLPSYRDLIRNMAAKRGANSNGTTGGGFYDSQVMGERRYIAAPAHHIPDDPENSQVEVEMDLEHGICFDGGSLLSAMFREGFDIETIRHRVGNPKGYREKQIGEFFMNHTLG